MTPPKIINEALPTIPTMDKANCAKNVAPSVQVTAVPPPGLTSRKFRDC